MKKALLVSALLFSARIMAQPVFDAEDLNMPFGPSPTVHSTDYVPAGPATAGFTFDVSTSTLGAGVQSQVMDPADSPYASYFPQATHASTNLTNQENYSYYTIGQNNFQFWGFYGPSSQMVYTNSEILYEFPMAYGNSWSDTFSGTVTAQGITMSRSGSNNVAYNGHGTIIMPFGEFNNVARLEIDQNYVDSYMGFDTDSHVNTVSYIMGGQPTALFTTSVVSVDMGGGMEPVSMISSIIEPAAVGIFETETASINALLLPNPATDIVTIAMSDVPGEGTEVMLFDATGRIIRTIAGGGMAQQQVIVFEVSDLVPGAYYVRLQDRSGANCVLPLIVE